MKRIILLLSLCFATFAYAAPDVSKTVEIGTPVVVAFVSSDGSQPFSYQWQKNGVNIAGATSAKLDVGATTQNSAGIYTLIVSNTKGSTVSNKCILSITITISPTNAVAGFL